MISTDGKERNRQHLKGGGGRGGAGGGGGGGGGGTQSKNSLSKAMTLIFHIFTNVNKPKAKIRTTERDHHMDG